MSADSGSPLPTHSPKYARTAAHEDTTKEEVSDAIQLPTSPAGTVGSWKEWLRGARAFIYDDDPVGRWVVAASLLPPLMALLQLPSFLLHVWGAAGSGKSAVAHFALSVWGNPTRLTGVLGAFAAPTIEAGGFSADLPILFDQWQGKGAPNVAVLRDAPKASAGSRAPRRTVTFSTGAGPIPQVPPDGLSELVFELNAPVSVRPETLYRAATTNYGHAGPRFINELALRAARSGSDWIKDIYDFFLKHLLKLGSDATPDQLACAAAVATAQLLCAELLFHQQHSEAFKLALNDALRVLKTYSANARATVDGAHFMADHAQRRQQQELEKQYSRELYRHGAVGAPHLLRVSPLPNPLATNLLPPNWPEE